MIYIETERLILKQHSMANLEKYHAWENDPELLYLSSDEPEDRAPEPLEETRKVMERLIQKGDLSSITIHYAIHLKEGDRFIGNGMIAFVDRYHRHCRLGIAISDKRERGKGFGKETLTAVIDFCFKTLNMHRIQAEVYAFNTPSIRLFESLGFKSEGCMRDNVLKRGEFEDEVIFGLLRPEWEEPLAGGMRPETCQVIWLLCYYTNYCFCCITKILTLLSNLL